MLNRSKAYALFVAIFAIAAGTMTQQTASALDNYQNQRDKLMVEGIDYEMVTDDSGKTSRQIIPVCDLSDLPCARGGKTCNIKFKNETGKGGGSGGGSTHNQISSTAKVSVATRDSNSKQFANKLQFDAAQSKTLNLDKRKKEEKLYEIVAKVNISSVDSFTTPNRAIMMCSQIREVLKGRAVCNVFVATMYGSGGMQSWPYTAYACNGGSVTSIKPDKLSQD